MATFEFGDLVTGTLDGVVIETRGERVLVCDNPFAATMIQHFGATLEYVMGEFDCAWCNQSEIVLDDDDGWDDED